MMTSQAMPTDNARVALVTMPAPAAAAAIQTLPPPQAATLVTTLRAEAAAGVLQHMKPSAGAAVLALQPIDSGAQLLALLPAPVAGKLLMPKRGAAATITPEVAAAMLAAVDPQVSPIRLHALRVRARSVLHPIWCISWSSALPSACQEENAL